MGMWECLQMVEVSQPMDGVLPLADCPLEAYMFTKTEIRISWNFQNTPLGLYEYDYVFFNKFVMCLQLKRTKKTWCDTCTIRQKTVSCEDALLQKNAEMYLNHLVCDQGSNAEGRNLLLILSFAPRDFSPRSSVFPSPRKPPFSISSSSRNGMVDEGLLSESATTKISVIHSFLSSFFLKGILLA